jgi:hypothetical protein
MNWFHAGPDGEFREMKEEKLLAILSKTTNWKMTKVLVMLALYFLAQILLAVYFQASHKLRTSSTEVAHELRASCSQKHSDISTIFTTNSPIGEFTATSSPFPRPTPSNVAYCLRHHFSSKSSPLMRCQKSATHKNLLRLLLVPNKN